MAVALAPPLYNVFQSTPDDTPYDDVPIPQSELDELNPSNGPMAAISEKQLWEADRVNPNLANQIQWAYRYGTDAACPRDLGSDGNNPCEITAASAAKAPIRDPVRVAEGECAISWACKNFGSDGDG
jgi:hypothetical protein